MRMIFPVLVGALGTACFSDPANSDPDGTGMTPTSSSGTDASAGPASSTDPSADGTAGVDTSNADGSGTSGDPATGDSGQDTGTTGGALPCVGEPLAFTWADVDVFVVDDDPQSLAGGDFDGDGDLDLVTGSYGGQTVSAWLGEGDGTFIPASASVPVGGNPTDLRVGAIADGVPDLFVRYYDGSTFDYHITRWRGVGDGTFHLATALGTGGAMNLGDFDADGFLDLAYAPANTMNVRFGDNLEIMGPPQPTSVVGQARAVDLDGDGALELVVVSGGSLQVYLNDGSGTFASGGSATVGAPVGGIGFGDINGDGDADIVTGTAGGGMTFASVYLGDGAGALSDPVTHTVPAYTNFVDVQDYDADGIGDALLVGLGGEMMFLHSNGDGTVDNAVVTVVQCNNLRGTALTDFNDDCIPDPIVLCNDDDSVHVFASQR